jgi:hypothetical protein
MPSEMTAEPPGPLIDAEHADFCDLDDRLRRGEWLSREETDRRQGYLLRVCPPPPPEVERERREQLRAQGIDFEAAYAAFNKGEHVAVEQFLVAVAPPPRAEMEVLERRINDAFKQASSKQAARRPRGNPSAGPCPRSGTFASSCSSHRPSRCARATVPITGRRRTTRT